MGRYSVLLDMVVSRYYGLLNTNPCSYDLLVRETSEAPQIIQTLAIFLVQQSLLVRPYC